MSLKTVAVLGIVAGLLLCWLAWSVANSLWVQI